MEGTCRILMLAVFKILRACTILMICLSVHSVRFIVRPYFGSDFQHRSREMQKQAKRTQLQGRIRHDGQRRCQNLPKVIPLSPFLQRQSLGRPIGLKLSKTATGHGGRTCGLITQHAAATAKPPGDPDIGAGIAKWGLSNLCATCSTGRLAVDARQGPEQINSAASWHCGHDEDRHAPGVSLR